MKTVRLVCARTLSAARSYYSAGIAAALFLSVSTVRFALSLDGGSHLPVQALWAAAAAPILGRFVRSRSPPHPKTAIRRPPAVKTARRLVKTRSSASSVWA